MSGSSTEQNESGINPLDVLKRIPRENIGAIARKAVHDKLANDGNNVIWDELTRRERDLIMLGAGMGAVEGWRCRDKDDPTDPTQDDVRHPSIDECHAAGKGPGHCPGFPYSEGGLPNTPEERARFEAYMRGHCWEIGHYDEHTRSYDTTLVRMLYGVWRDRGSLSTIRCPKNET